MNRFGQGQPPESPYEQAPQQSPPQSESGGGGAKPVATFRYPAGKGAQIEFAIWQNTGQGQNGEYKTYSVTISRNYYQDGEWKKAKSFRPTDLPVVVCGAQQVFQALVDEQSKG